MANKLIVLFLTFFSHLQPVFSQPEFSFEHFNTANTAVMSSGNNFRSVSVNSTGKIWAGSLYQGIFRYTPATALWEKSSDLTNVSVNDIRLGQSDDIWVGQSGTVGTGSIAGGVNRYANDGSVTISNFYSITGTGGLTSRNVRSVWIDKNHRGEDNKYRVWAAQGTYVSSGNTLAGGISVGINTSGNSFTKIYKGLQVTPNVPSGQAGTPNCIAIGGNTTEVWVCALQNFGRSQILRYRADDPGTFIGYYDYTNTPALTAGFRANVIFFDQQGRGWIGLNEGGLLIKTTEGWTTMNHISVLPAGTAINANAITQDARGHIYFGTSNGLLEYNGGVINDAASYRMITTTDGLPQNNIAGVAADTVNKRIVLAHSGGISFMKFNKKIDYSLEWDYSFPKENVKPLGVAADGTSRLYMKIRRGTNVTMPIKKIGVSIKNIATQTASLCGKVKKAIETSQYSNEANSGTATEAERTDSTANGDFYFWYVAPDDFSADSLSNFAQLGERNDTVKIKVTYADNSEDSTYMPVKVVRPPIVIAGMLAKSAEIFRELKTPEGTPLLQSSKYPSRLMMLNALKTYNDNVTKMMEEDDDRENTGSGSIPQVIRISRRKGISATKVDMVAHGIGGNVARKMIQIKPEKYFSDGNNAYNNYGKGYINKLISVNVPHNGSPLFQLLNDYEKTENKINRKRVFNLVKAEPEIAPYQVAKAENSQLVMAAPLFRKALADAGIDDMPETPVKNHLIGTELGEDPPSGINTRFAMLRNLMRYQVLNMRDMDPVMRPKIDSILQTPGNMDDKVDDIMGLYSTSKGQANFTKMGDLISSIGSQVANAAQGVGHATIKMASSLEENDHERTLGYSSKLITNLLNTSIHSNSFANSISAKIAAQVGAVATKVGATFYDTTKIVITNREELSGPGFRLQNENNTEANDTTVILKYTVKDTSRLQYVCISFQDTMYLSYSKDRNQQIPLRIKKTMWMTGLQEISAVAMYESTDSLKYHADTLNTWVSKPAVEGFRILEEEAQLVEGINYTPHYEVKINDKWEPLPANDTEISFTIENASKAGYNSTDSYFKALEDGFTRVYFQYKTYSDTVSLHCMLPFSEIAINRTIVNGSFKAATTWSKGRTPLASDSVIISTGHNTTLDTTVRIRSLKIETGATLTLNNSSLQLQLGDAEDGAFMIDNNGALNISNGTLKVSGRVKHNAGASFNMSGGLLVMDANTGHTINSLENGLYMFEAAPGMALFNFTGGTLQFIDPPIGVSSQALFCPYNFGANSTLILGNGISVTASNNPNGFGGNGFPPQIGKLILDASTQGNNRQLRITKPLSVKGSFEIRNGSNLSIQAPVTVMP